MKRKLTTFNFYIIYITCAFIVMLVFIRQPFATPTQSIIQISLQPDLSNNIDLQDTNTEGSVYIFVPSNFQTITLSWNQNTDEVDGYYVYRGVTPTTASNKLSTVLRTKLQPQITYKISTDLAIVAGDPICFRLKAYNIIGESAFSDAACTQIPGVNNISFYIDDDGLSAAPFYIDKNAPWLLNDGAFDLNTLSTGVHIITAVANFNDGSVRKYSSSFNSKKKLSTPNGLILEHNLMFDVIP